MAVQKPANKKDLQEIILKAPNGLPILVLNIILIALALYLFIRGTILASTGENIVLGVVEIIVGALYGFVAGPIIFAGFKVLKPNEALVLTLFGKYYGTLKGEGFYFVHPFAATVNPVVEKTTMSRTSGSFSVSGKSSQGTQTPSKKISLKTSTLNNAKQKINDLLGNPIEIGIVVIWRVVNTAKAVFNVDDYLEFLSIQSDSALRDIVRKYPYDTSLEDKSEMTLRGSSNAVASELKQKIQEKVEIAGLEILEVGITHLAYAPEIAAAMLQRQQATAIIDARQMIVEGAVSMVQMALNQLSENKIVELDEERKAAMVSNLLVVLCGNRDAQPVINSGTIY